MTFDDERQYNMYSVTSDSTTVLGVQCTLNSPIINSCQVIIRHLIPVLYKNKRLYISAAKVTRFL